MTIDLVQARRQADAYLNQSQHQPADIFLSTDKAAEFVGCPTREAFRKWAKRAKVTLLYRGRRVLVSRRDLEAELRRKAVR